MEYAVMMDFGSTYTKVVCVDLQRRTVILTDKFPSTVHEDAGISMGQCIDAVSAVIGRQKAEKALMLSSSSAAGGLRIAVVGLTRSLSNAAGRNACFSAGGKLVHSVHGILTEADIETIASADAEIILLCGGYERGNSQGVLRNARILSESHLRIPVIYAGNSEAAQSVRGMFLRQGRECFLAENIIPEVGALHIAPTTDIIRELFLSRITNMQGVSGIARHLDAPIMPTPQAVLRAGELLSRGTAEEAGIGPFMMVDLGGATTDVYSFMENTSYEGARCIGLEEPYGKRTVEGDLGMRESAGTLIREVGEETFARACGISTEEAKAAAVLRNDNRAWLADTPMQRRIDGMIASEAVRISARRHAGYVERGYMQGVRLLQHGKNLTEITGVVGTGGSIVNAAAPEEILAGTQVCDEEIGSVLLPQKVHMMVDRNYVMYAAGLLAAQYPQAALAIMKESIGRRMEHGKAR